MYGSTLVVFEALPTESPGVTMYVPRALCVLSRWPFLDAFSRYLRELYVLSGYRAASPAKCPPGMLEACVCNLLMEVPLPPRGRASVQFSIGDAIITVQRPPVNAPPAVVDRESLLMLFQLLDIDNVLLLLSCLLSEQRVVFHAAHRAVLAPCTEALINLLFPFTWCHVYIPYLPAFISLEDFVQAPVPFLVGVSSSNFAGLRSLGSVVEVNLNANTVTIPSGVSVPRLPARVGADLREGLHGVVKGIFDPARAFARVIGTHRQLDTRRGVGGLSASAHGQETHGFHKPFRARGVQELFIDFFVAMLHDYDMYMQVSPAAAASPSDASSEVEAQDAFASQSLSFDAERFLANKAELGPFVKSLLQTQLFAQFVDLRTSSKAAENNDVAFFDKQCDASGADFLKDTRYDVVKTHVAPAPDTSRLDKAASVFDAASAELLGFPVLDDWLLATYRPNRSQEMLHDCIIGEDDTFVSLRRQSNEARHVFASPTAPEFSARRLSDLGLRRVTDRSLAIQQQVCVGSLMAVTNITDRDVSYARGGAGGLRAFDATGVVAMPKSAGPKSLRSAEKMATYPPNQPMSERRRRRGAGMSGRRAGPFSPFTPPAALRALALANSSKLRSGTPSATPRAHDAAEHRARAEAVSPVAVKLDFADGVDERVPASEPASSGSAHSPSCSSGSSTPAQAAVAEAAVRDRVVEALARLHNGRDLGAAELTALYCDLIDAYGAGGAVDEAVAVFEQVIQLSLSVAVDEVVRRDSGSTQHELEVINEDVVADTAPPARVRSRTGSSDASEGMTFALDSAVPESTRWLLIGHLVRVLIVNGELPRALLMISSERSRREKVAAARVGAAVRRNSSAVSQAPASPKPSKRDAFAGWHELDAVFTTAFLGLKLVPGSSGIGAVVSEYDATIGSIKQRGDGDAVTPQPGDVVFAVGHRQVLGLTTDGVRGVIRHSHRPVRVRFLRAIDDEAKEAPELTETAAGIRDKDEGEAKSSAATSPSKAPFFTENGVKIDASVGAQCPNPECNRKLGCNEVLSGMTADAHDYTTSCASCGTRFVARFCVKSTAACDTAATGDGCWLEFLSCATLRKEVETVIMREGRAAATLPVLRAKRPLLFWNVVLALHDIACPADFLLQDAEDARASLVPPRREDEDHSPSAADSDGEASSTDLGAAGASGSRGSFSDDESDGCDGAAASPSRDTASFSDEESDADESDTDRSLGTSMSPASSPLTRGASAGAVVHTAEIAVATESVRTCEAGVSATLRGPTAHVSTETMAISVRDAGVSTAVLMVDQSVSTVPPSPESVTDSRHAPEVEVLPARDEDIPLAEATMVGAARAERASDACDVGGVRAELARLQAAADREARERRRLANEVQSLTGAVRVLCRVRPMTADERSGGADEALSAIGDTSVRLAISRPGAASAQSFDFDRVLDGSSTQEDVFSEVAPMVAGVLDGYNACVFAYGQTGAGKTHTMEGRGTLTSEDAGVTPRALARLFSEIDERSGAPGAPRFAVHMGMVEIYNEEVRDLLPRDGAHSSRVDIHQRPSAGGQHEVHLHGLNRIEVKSAAEALEHMARGASHRSVADNHVHSRSSRSHSATLVWVTSSAERAAATVTVTAKLILVDLAGSERLSRTGFGGAGGDASDKARLREAQAINKSLSALGNVISALADNASRSTSASKAHVPYRDSKLTFLLMDTLGGSCKTAMVVAVSPSDRNADESLCSLQFASRVRRVKNAVRQNVSTADAATTRQLAKAKAAASHATERAAALSAEVDELRAAADAARLERDAVAESEQSVSEQLAAALRDVETLRGSVAGLREENERLLAEITKANAMQQSAHHDDAASAAVETPAAGADAGELRQLLAETQRALKAEQIRRGRAELDLKMAKSDLRVARKRGRELEDVLKRRRAGSGDVDERAVASPGTGRHHSPAPTSTTPGGRARRHDVGKRARRLQTTPSPLSRSSRASPATPASAGPATRRREPLIDAEKAKLEKLSGDNSLTRGLAQLAKTILGTRSSAASDGQQGSTGDGSPAAAATVATANSSSESGHGSAGSDPTDAEAGFEAMFAALCKDEGGEAASPVPTSAGKAGKRPAALRSPLPSRARGIAMGSPSPMRSPLVGKRRAAHLKGDENTASPSNLRSPLSARKQQPSSRRKPRRGARRTPLK